MIIAARLQVKGDPIFKKTSLMLVIECTLISRAARDFDIQIMKTALLVFGIASVTLCASFAQQSSGNSEGVAARDRPVDQKRVPLVRANRERRANEKHKISRGRRLRAGHRTKAPAAQRVPPRQPVPRQTEQDLPRQAPTGYDLRLRVFPPEFVQQPLPQRAQRQIRRLHHQRPLRYLRQRRALVPPLRQAPLRQRVRGH